MAAPVFASPAGQELLKVLQQHGLPQHAIAAVAELVVKLVAEGPPGPQQRQDGQQQPDQRQQQHAAQQQQAAACGAPQQPRDLRQADAVLQAVPFISPRGKFDVGFFEDCLQLSNKQTWAAVRYDAIQHVLVIDAIPKQPDTTNVVLVMKSGQPVQQGKNRLDIVVMQTKDKPELSLPAPPACVHLGDALTGAAAVVLSQLLATYLPGLADDTFLTADADVFASAAGDLMVAANRGAQPGWLVPLSAGLCYIGKGGCFLGCSSIAKVLLHRTGAGSSTFDVTVMRRRGGRNAGGAGDVPAPLELGQIGAAELAHLQEYLQRQRIRVGSLDEDSDDDDGGGGINGEAAAAVAGAAAGAAGAAGDEDDDDDEDDDYDPAAAAGSSRKRRRSSATGGGGAGDDDDDEDGAEADGGSDDDESDASADDGDSDEEVSLVVEDGLDDDNDDDAFAE